MRFIKVGVALAAFSPAFLLLGLGVWGRWATFGVPPTPGDPPTVAERLRAYRSFVKAAREGNAVWTSKDPLSPAAYRALWAALDSARPESMPAIETSLTTPPARDDVRKPILEAQIKIFLAAKRAYSRLLKRRDFEEAAKVAVAIYKLTLVSRNFDFSPFVSSSNQRAQLAEMLKEGMPNFSEVSRNLLATSVKNGERNVRLPVDIMRNDVILLQLDFANTAQSSQREMAIPRIAEEALHRLENGDSISWYLPRISKWPASQDRDRLWQLIASWEIMQKRHQSDKRNLFRAVGLDSKTLTAQLSR